MNRGKIERMVDRLVGGVLEAAQILYHVAFEKNVPAIRSRGIGSQKKGTWTGAAGQDIRRGKGGMIYAFTSFDDAARWAFKQEFDSEEPTVVVRFRDDRSAWEEDTHWQAGLAKGVWLKKRGSVPASAVIDTIKVTPAMTRSLVRTAGGPEEVEPPSVERVVDRLMSDDADDEVRQDTEADKMVARYKAQPVSLWTFTELPIEERMAWAYLAADEFMGADFQGDLVAQFVSALKRVTAKPNDFWEQIREKDPLRVDYLRRLNWSIRIVPLKDAGVYPRFSGYPKEWCLDSVIETADFVINAEGFPVKRHRILSLAATYQTVLKFLPPILVPTGTVRKDADFSPMAYEIDDGNHRAVAAAIGGATHMVAFAGAEEGSDAVPD